MLNHTFHINTNYLQVNVNLSKEGKVKLKYKFFFYCWQRELTGYNVFKLETFMHFLYYKNIIMRDKNIFYLHCCYLRNKNFIFINFIQVYFIIIKFDKN